MKVERECDCGKSNLFLKLLDDQAGWFCLNCDVFYGLDGFEIQLYKYALLSIALGGGITLILVTQAVLTLDPWYAPQSMVPIAGMIFANAMNSVSLSAERLNAEVSRGVSYDEARNIAFQSSLIPVINSLFAVGLVSLPGMMTGQILSGVSPLIAVRYQIMVMCMVFGF